MSDVIPEYWAEPTAAVPECARAAGWLLALPVLVALPITPRRLGAHIARAPWGATLLVHVVCLVAGLLLGALSDGLAQRAAQPAFAIGVVSLPGDTPVWGETAGVAERLRWLTTGAINRLYVRTDGSGGIYALIGGLAAVHAGAWLIGLLLMSFIAAGERSRLLYLRSVKLTLWSAACLVPLGLAILGVVYLGVRYDEHFDDVEWETAIAGVVAAWLLWWLSVLLRLGARYAGPADGPGWQARQPRCNRCSYVLTGLSREGRCPECGLAVRESLALRGSAGNRAPMRGPRGTCCADARSSASSQCARRSTPRCASRCGRFC